MVDVYLTANQKKNRLYINKGGFEFEDVTEKAGVGGSKPWSTGVSMADVNGDGLLDIYVTNSGQFGKEDRENELFINKGNLSFTEQAGEFGIADIGNSIHASFFDYDKDGYLDLYVLNNYASKPIAKYNLDNNLREKDHLRGGDRLYRNDGGEFTDVTDESGIYSSEIGFGLGVSVGDVNRDGWMDIFVSNDFFERDYLYINQGDGTFKDRLPDILNSTSSTSMGGDIADINHDGFPEIYSTDMLPSKEVRIKTVTDFVRWERLQRLQEMGYYRTFARNMLHYNNGNGTFSEIGRYAGVESSAWSWGALIADFNLDGDRDIFVPNGFYKDVTNNDLALRIRKKEVRKELFRGGRMNYKKLVEMTPSVPLSNYMFENVGSMVFKNRSEEWGLDEPGFSNGSAYGDLDNDGDLDLVVNNVNAKSSVYRNTSSERHPNRTWLQLGLEGEPPNTFGVGTQVTLTADGRRWYVEQMPQRGFQSSVDPTLHVGLGTGVSTIDTLKVRWPDGRLSLRTGVATNRRLILRQAEAQKDEERTPEVLPPDRREKRALLADVTGEMGLNWTHEESSYSDFNRSPLLFHMRSTEGPPLCTGDVTGDGREDVYVGGAAGQPGALFIQEAGGHFVRMEQPALRADRNAEDTDCELFDADGKGALELYVASGSSEFPAESQPLADRLYQINEEGVVSSMDALPQPREGPLPTGVVRAADVNGDGAQDLFVGTRMAPPKKGAPQGYGVPVGGRLLENTGTGRFEDATRQLAPQLRAEEIRTAGITDAAWGDLNGDETPDLVVAGEWMPLTVFFNRNDELERADPQSVGLDSTSGWWQSLTLADLDGNGTPDLVAGNHGLNSRFRASPKYPVEMWASDFNRNGKLNRILATHRDQNGPYPVALYQNLVQQLPYLKSHYSTFSDYAGQTVSDVFEREQLEAAEHYRAEQLASVVGWNEGEGHFRVDSLPSRAQWAPMYGILAKDLDGQGNGAEILMGGNLRAVKPQAGPYTASYGVFLRPDSTGSYQEVSPQESGFSLPGEIRAIRTLNTGARTLILVARNDAPLKIYAVGSPQRPL